MAEKIIRLFDKGIYNLQDPEIIPDGAAKDSINFVNKDGKIVLIGGRKLLGAEGDLGGTTGIHIGYKVNGDKVYYCKMGVYIKYYDGDSWEDTGITGFEADEEVTFANYSSLAGNFTFIAGINGYWKINNTFPTSPMNIYSSTKNFKGFILIDRGRTILWNRAKDKTGLYGSKIDPQDSDVYTTVSYEEISGSGATRTGSLAFNTTTRNCFAVSFDSGAESFTDNYLGILTGNAGGTGTINYATGAYAVTFHTAPLSATMTATTISFASGGKINDSANSFVSSGFSGQPYIKVSGSTSNDGIYKVLGVEVGQITIAEDLEVEGAGDTVTISAVVVANYQWEDSTVGGLADFTKSSTRLAGEGFQFPQDEGGDAILKVEVGQDGNYYSLKQNSSYRLSIDTDDLGADNQVFRKDMGLPFFRASVSSNRGIVFMNTANPTNPELTILQKNKVSLDVEPVVLFPQFDFSKYEYDECGFSTYDRWILVFCKTKGADNNDTIIMCNIPEKTVNVIKYSGKMAVQDDDKLYVGDSITYSVYNILNEFDDLGLPLDAYWEGKEFIFGTENLKKVRRLRIKGFIDPDQVVEVYANIDENGYQLVGEINGNGSYVNYNETQAVGANFIGESQIGGDDITNAYGYYREIRLKLGKFRKVNIKFVPTGIGYFDFNLTNFWEILLFEARIPKAYRSKKT